MGKPAAVRLTAVDTATGGDVIELAFAVTGGRLPRDHSFALWMALERVAGWLADDEATAVLPIRAASAGDQGLVLGRHSRLMLRLHEARVEAALELCGKRLDVAGVPVELGGAKTRPLTPHATLYAHRVAVQADSEEAFVRQVTSDLARLGIHSEFIVGRRASAHGLDGELAGFSVMLAQLGARDSLKLQAAGLGAHRRLGFGVFVGHK
jgi:CRISPR-associated protein Cas6